MLEQLAQGWGILVVDPELLAHALVPQLGERLGARDPEAVQKEVFAVGMGLEERSRTAGRLPTHSDAEGAEHVRAARVDRQEEVRDAQAAALALARKGEPGEFALLVGRVEDDQVVSLGVCGEVAVDERGLQKALPFSLEAQPLEDRLGLLGEEFLELRVAQIPLLEPPLPAVEGGLVHKGVDMLEGDVSHHACAPERWRGDAGRGPHRGPQTASVRCCGRSCRLALAVVRSGLPRSHALRTRSPALQPLLDLGVDLREAAIRDRLHDA